MNKADLIFNKKLKTRLTKSRTCQRARGAGIGLLTLLAAIFLGLLQGCASSGPKTQYYTLFSANLPAPSDHHGWQGDKKFGVGPIALPEYLERPGIVSFVGANQIRVSGHRAWAGDLKENIARVVADNLADAWGAESVMTFPWDNRYRPDYQVKIVFHQLAGELGRYVELKAQWTVYNKADNSLVIAGTEKLEEKLTGGYQEYLAGINKVVTRLSQNMAAAIANQMAVNPE